MRRTFALGCCALTLAFCFAASTTHAHRAGESRHHHHDHPRDADSSHDHEHGLAHDHHHEGVYLSAAVVRAAGSRVRPMVAIVAPGPAIERSTAIAFRVEIDAGVASDPPGKFPTRLRAPPA